MKKKIVLLTLVSIFLASTVITTAVTAQPRTVGVSVGDWFKYGDITGSWSSNDPNAIYPFLEFNETEWMRVSVEDVSGTNITFQTTVRFTNGTEETGSGHIDIDTGDGNMTLMAISANLNANDTVYSSPGYSTQKINGTVIRTYPDGVRETNYWNITAEYNMTGFYQYISQNWYWDRTSGIFVEMAQEYTSQTENYTTTWSLSLRITESTVWVIPEFPTYTSILLAFAILTVTIVMTKRRLLKTPIK